MYNTSWMNNNMTSFQDYMTGVNQGTGGLLGIMLLAIIFVVIFVVSLSKQGEFDKSLAFSSFVTTILAIFMWGAGFVATHIAIMPAVITVFAIFIMLFKN